MNLFVLHLQKLKSRRGSNNDLAKKPVKSIDLDKIDASLKSIRSAIAHTKITQEKLCINCTNEKYLDFKNQGNPNICSIIYIYIFTSYKNSYKT
jgi:hypothetical protein